jgi:hypothetical protein
MSRALLLLVLLALAPLAAAQEKVLVRRLSDVVAVREGPRSTERVLYYFNPTVELAEGDHVEQGSGGHAEIKLAGEGLVILHANAHVILQHLAAEGDVLSFATVTRAEASAGDRPLQLLLPGGTICDLLQTHVTVFAVFGRLIIRNEGSTTVRLTSDLRLDRDQASDVPVGRLDLARGEEVRLMLVGGDVPAVGQSVDLWGAVAVRHTGNIQILPDGDQLRLQPGSGETPLDGSLLTVRGVRVVAHSGLLVRNPRHVESPAAPVETVPAPEPPAPELPAPDAGDNPPPSDEGAPPDAPAGDQPK